MGESFGNSVPSPYKLIYRGWKYENKKGNYSCGGAWN